MFYSIDILRRRGGRFGTVWLAATNQKALHKRDYYAVNVAKTGEDLRTFILGEMRSHGDGGHRMRFSLYLSSQLMFGVIRIYEKQAAYLLSELLKLADSFHCQPQHKALTINLTPSRVQNDSRHGRNNQTLTSPDLAEALMDRELGTFDMLNPIPPEELPEVCVWPPFDSPDVRQHRDTRNVSLSSQGLIVQKDLLQAHPEDITMRDDIPILPAAEVPPEEDLPMANEMDVIEALIGADISERLFSSDTSSKRREKKSDKTQSMIHSEATGQPKRPTKRGKEHLHEPDVTPTTPPVVPVQKPLAAVRLDLSPCVGDEVARPRHHKKKRLVIDDKIRLPNGLNTKPSLRSAPIESSLPHGQQVDKLFHMPGRKDMRGKVLLQLWNDFGISRASASFDESSYGNGDSVSAGTQEGGQASLHAAVLEQALPEDALLLSVEQQREASRLSEERSLRADVSGIAVSRRPSSVKSTSAEASDNDITLERGTAGQQSELAIVEELPEDFPFVPEPLAAINVDTIRVQLEASGEYMTFEDICPLNNTTDVAAEMFLALLDGAAKEFWEVLQTNTFGEIHIRRC